MEEKIKPELHLQGMLNLDVEKSKKEFHKQLDELLNARQELFDKRLTEGVEKHKKFLELTK